MASMLSLLDVLPRHERVDIGSDSPVDVFGISGGDIGKILERYPNAFQQIANSATQVTMMDAGLLGCLLAASSRNGSGESLLGNDEAEKIGRNLAAADQMKLLQAVGRCSFPDGIGPFLESLVLMSSLAEEAMEVVVQVASKDQATKSPPGRRPSAPPVTPTSGN
jgi:hypothetical protein